MRDVKAKWLQRGYGLDLGPLNLSELRFADDLVLVGKSRAQICSMMTDVIDAAALRGLEVHPDKTKVMCNRCVRKGRLATKYVEVRGMRVEVLPHTASCKYLGRM